MDYEEYKEILEQKERELREHMFDDSVARAFFISDVNKNKAENKTLYREIKDEQTVSIYLVIIDAYGKDYFPNIKVENNKLYMDLLKTKYSELPDVLKEKYIVLAQQCLKFVELGNKPINKYQKIAKAFYHHYNDKHHNNRTLSVEAEQDSSCELEKFEFGDALQVHLVKDGTLKEDYAIFRDANMMFHKLTIQEGINLAQGYSLGVHLVSANKSLVHPISAKKTDSLGSAFLLWNNDVTEILSKPCRKDKIKDIYTFIDGKLHNYAFKAIKKQSNRCLVMQNLATDNSQ